MFRNCLSCRGGEKAAEVYLFPCPRARLDGIWLEVGMDAVRLLVIALVLAGSVANAQSYRGEAIPVVQRVDPVEFSRVRFLTFAFGHEGPMDAPLSTPPVA